MSKRVLAVTGRLGKDPVEKGTTAGDVVEFSLAVTTSYDDDAQATWIQVSVWNQGLRDQIMEGPNQLSKGSSVAVEGIYTEKEGDNGGDKFRNLKAARIGPVTWFERTKEESQQAAAAPAARARASVPAAVAAPADDSDFPF